MADRPAKRQRRSTIILSDEEDPKSPELPLRTSSKSNAQLELDRGNGATLTLSPNRSKSKAKPASKKPRITASPKSSPGKPGKASKGQKESEKSKSLHTFFTRASEEQRWHRKSQTPEGDVEDGEFGDAIEDDDLSDDAFIELAEGKPLARNILDRRKPLISKAFKTSLNSNGLPPSSSQRFVKPPLPTNQPKTLSISVPIVENQLSHKPWADRYGPTSLEELAVHKKKVADVQRWLENVLAGRDRQRLLVLKGPAGSGKTATISLLSQALGFGLVSWNNPVSAEIAVSGSVASQFDDFLGRGGQFDSLSLSEDNATPSASSAVSDRRVLLVEEFPASMTRSSSAPNSFRSVLLQFLSRQSSTPVMPFRTASSSTDVSPPMVMIISETLLSSSTTFSDSFTAHRLLGPEILNHHMVSVMEFNPVAPTFVNKALDLVIKKEARDSKRRRIPGPAVLQKLADMGDVRSAVNSLEFLCVRGDSSADWSGTVAKKASKDSVALTDMEKNSLNLVSERETTLDMFHAAGKIVYNKREDPRTQDRHALPPPKPPEHLMYLYTPKVSQVDIEALLNETGTDIQTFISTLHENYVLSCNGESFAEDFEGCSDVLSISDILNPDSRRTRRSKNSNAAISQSSVQAGTSDTLRQDEISFQNATRGLLFFLPHPVNRAAAASGRKADSFKMFYPASLRLWKPTEEIDSLISLFVHDESIAIHSSSTDATNAGGVASWRARTDGFDATGTSAHDRESQPPLKLPASRDDLALEILPYMTKIHTSRKQDAKILSRITQFHGMQISGDEPSDEEEMAAEDAGAAERDRSMLAVLGSRRGVSKGVGNLKATGKDKEQELQMEKLYISDDDIQDD